MVYDYTPHGVCSQHIHLEVEDGVIRSVEFLGGCNGNLKGISS
ncbi:MAG: TSCPD domain-containing protein, partial [Oscillospiraceae bacterium]|nr:TSCPD domain-containing protein [Oscillospiraceae bacterium]